MTASGKTKRPIRRSIGTAAVDDGIDDRDAPVASLGDRLRAAVAAIPRGRVCSYGQVAQRAGAPGRARAVGRALGQAPDGMKLPWHRVMRAGGVIAFPKGSPGFEEQVKRLTREGVKVVNGRVDLAAFGFEESLDLELWGGMLR
jgi:methylated-DNA-protein-cysteine methyltransferase-like protein